jgi:serine/threonine protein kinase
MASLTSNLTINTDDRWITIISNITNGIYQKIGHGSYKQVYMGENEKVYATESVVSDRATFLFDKLNKMSESIKKHVLIPDAYVERNGVRYWEMDYCKADLDIATGDTDTFLQTFSIKELSTNFVELEKTVSVLHAGGITAMDIKPANMLFICANNDRSIQITDLDGSMFNNEGEPHLTLQYTYLKFEEDYKKQDLFALYTSFLQIIDNNIWDYHPMQWYRSMEYWTGRVRSKLNEKENSKNDLIKLYLNKLNALEQEKKEQTDIHRSAADIFSKLKY